MKFIPITETSATAKSSSPTRKAWYALSSARRKGRESQKARPHVVDRWLQRARPKGAGPVYFEPLTNAVSPSHTYVGRAKSFSFAKDAGDLRRYAKKYTKKGYYDRKNTIAGAKRALASSGVALRDATTRKVLP